MGFYDPSKQNLVDDRSDRWSGDERVHHWSFQEVALQKTFSSFQSLQVDHENYKKETLSRNTAHSPEILPKDFQCLWNCASFQWWQSQNICLHLAATPGFFVPVQIFSLTFGGANRRCATCEVQRFEVGRGSIAICNFFGMYPQYIHLYISHKKCWQRKIIDFFECHFWRTQSNSSQEGRYICVPETNSLHLPGGAGI